MATQTTVITVHGAISNVADMCQAAGLARQMATDTRGQRRPVYHGEVADPIARELLTGLQDAAEAGARIWFDEAAGFDQAATLAWIAEMGRDPRAAQNVEGLRRAYAEIRTDGEPAYQRWQGRLWKLANWLDR